MTDRHSSRVQEPASPTYTATPQSAEQVESRWLNEQTRKPASQMSDAEWDAHKAWVDEQRAGRGEAPLDWRGIPKPAPASERTLAYLLGTTPKD